jgi:hypothetical protein
MKKKKHTFVEQAQNAKISFKDAAAILTQAAALPAERRDFYGLMAIVIEQFKSADMSKTSRKAFAFMERMHCLAEISKKPKMKAWMKDNGLDDGGVLIEESVVRAMLNCTLIYEGDKGPQFDSDEFFDLALKSRKTEGKC